MAMNKREKQELENAITRAREARALRWSDYPDKPDLPPPGPGSPFRARTEGWQAHTGGGLTNPRVTRAWSEQGAHDTGEYPEDRRPSSASQGGAALHSTKLHALGALRRELERRFAWHLAEIDRQIEEEMACLSKS
jgi:hypothetical protein